jgi:hypothetical protein
MCKEYKHMRRIHQEYLAVYVEYAGRHKIERIQIINQLPIHDRMEKNISRYCLFKFFKVIKCS